MSTKESDDQISENTVDSLRPLLSNVNLRGMVFDVKVLVNRRRPDGIYAKLAEAKVGDETGYVIMTLRDEQVDLVKVDDFIYVQNGKVEMYKLMMRLVCDKKVGKLTVEDKKPGWKINMDYNVSAIEYELVVEREGPIKRPANGTDVAVDESVTSKETTENPE